MPLNDSEYTEKQMDHSFECIKAKLIERLGHDLNPDVYVKLYQIIHLIPHTFDSYEGAAIFEAVGDGLRQLASYKEKENATRNKGL